MKVFVQPTGLYSRAMVRVAEALKKYAPATVEIVDNVKKADLHVLHVVDWAAQFETDKGWDRPFAAIQYCLRSTSAPLHKWEKWWQKAHLVWSYYDLANIAEVPGPFQSRWNISYSLAHFYHSPLGIDDAFLAPLHHPRDRALSATLLTTGYVHGAAAECIEEVWLAAERAGLQTVHIGPRQVQGASRCANLHREGISDKELAGLLRSVRHVVSLRGIEGFEMPALEAMSCGTRPLVFDQPTLRHWYRDNAIYVPECSGEPLMNELCKIFNGDVSNRLDDGEVTDVRSRFRWDDIASGFWKRVLGDRP